MLDMVEPAEPTNVDPEHGTSVGQLLEFTIWTVLQIRRGNRDDLGIISHISP